MRMADDVGFGEIERVHDRDDAFGAGRKPCVAPLDTCSRVAFPKYLDSTTTLATVTPLVTAAALRISRLLGMPPAMVLIGSTGSVCGGT